VGTSLCHTEEHRHRHCGNIVFFQSNKRPVDPQNCVTVQPTRTYQLRGFGVEIRSRNWLLKKKSSVEDSVRSQDDGSFEEV
jgi:hypothetical protein